MTTDQRPVTLAQWLTAKPATRQWWLDVGAVFSPEAYPVVVAERGDECARVLQWCPRSQRLSALT